MALLLRFSPSESALRSVDDCPGLLCSAVEQGRPTFAISASTPPPQFTRDARAVMLPRAGIEDLLEVDDVVHGCESGQELRLLLDFVVGLVDAMSRHALPQLAFEALTPFLDFAVEVRDAVLAELAARGELVDPAGGGG